MSVKRCEHLKSKIQILKQASHICAIKSIFILQNTIKDQLKVFKSHLLCKTGGESLSSQTSPHSPEQGRKMSLHGLSGDPLSSGPLARCSRSQSGEGASTGGQERWRRGPFPCDPGPPVRISSSGTPAALMLPLARMHGGLP